MLVHGRTLSIYQRSLAKQELDKLIQSTKDANQFILDIAVLLDIETDGVGFDEIQLSIDDFKDAIERL